MSDSTPPSVAAPAPGAPATAPPALARAGVEDLLGSVFAGIAVLRGLALAVHARAAAEDRAPTSTDLAGIRPTVLEQLAASGGFLAGTGVIAAPGTLADRPRWLEWWRLPYGRAQEPCPLCVDLDPHSVGGYEYPAAEWFEVPRRTGRPAVVGPYVDYAGTDEYVLTFSVPVSDGSGFLGVAAADVRATDLERAALPVLDAAGHASLLVNPSGRVIASNTPLAVAGSLAPQGRTRLLSFPTGEEWEGCAGLPWQLAGAPEA